MKFRLNLVGFTLIELLVVISIIALLISILMPALGRARKQAKASVCMTNLRSMGQAHKIHNVETEGKMVDIWENNVMWIEKLTEYTKNDDMKTCPEAIKLIPNAIFRIDDQEDFARLEWGGAKYAWATKYTETDRTVLASYGMNAWVQSGRMWAMTNESNKSKHWGGNDYTGANPSEIPVTLDCVYREAVVSDRDRPPTQPYDTYIPVGGRGEMRRFTMKRHKDGINGVFMDGHAEYIDIPRLWTLKWYRGFETRYDITIDW